MRGGHFGTTAAVDEFEAGHRAARVIGGEHGGAEHAVADDARCQAFGTDPLLFETERALGVVERRRKWRGGIADARQHAFVVAEAEIDDADEILWA